MNSIFSFRWYVGRLLVVLFSLSGPCAAQNNDINTLRNINRQRSATADPIMIGITNSAEPLAISLPVALLITGYARHDKAMVRNGWQTVAALGITGIISTGLKYSVNRTRPYITYPDIQNYNTENTASFPSGHTSFAFATATSLSINYRMWYVVAPAYLWAASVGYSRLYLGEHYPTDVLAGCIVGAGSAWLAYKGDQWLHRRKEQRHKVPQ